MQRNTGDFVTLAELLYLKRAEIITLTLIAFTTIVKFLRYFSLIPRVHLYLIMMGAVLHALGAFMIVYLVLGFAFAIVSHMMFREVGNVFGLHLHNVSPPVILFVGCLWLQHHSRGRKWKA